MLCLILNPIKFWYFFLLAMLVHVWDLFKSVNQKALITTVNRQASDCFCCSRHWHSCVCLRADRMSLSERFSLSCFRIHSESKTLNRNDKSKTKKRKKLWNNFAANFSKAKASTGLIPCEVSLLGIELQATGRAVDYKFIPCKHVSWLSQVSRDK